MKNSLAIVVLTWNDFMNTKRCVQSIFPSLSSKVKLILVDNGSEDYFIKNKFLKGNYKNKIL